LNTAEDLVVAFAERDRWGREDGGEMVEGVARWDKGGSDKFYVVQV
jgi:hypothetical protein